MSGKILMEESILIMYFLEIIFINFSSDFKISPQTIIL